MEQENAAVTENQSINGDNSEMDTQVESPVVSVPNPAPPIPVPPLKKDNDIHNSPEEKILSIVSQEQITKLRQNNVLLIPEEQMQMMLNTLSQSSANLAQSSAGLEQSQRMIVDLQSKLKEQRKLTKKFYQLEAVALANKEALENILKSFDISSGWPTIEVFTAEGWVRGSVNYVLHNAMVLARAAIQSENLKVIENHLSGLNGSIKLLQQDIEDMLKLTNGKVTKCRFCNRMKVTDQICWVCGKSDIVDKSDEEDEDDDE